MAKQRFKGALSNATFPYVSILQARTVVQAQLDINTRPSRAGATEDASDYSFPQVSYCENVVPTGEGYQSVGYNQMIAPLAAAATNFDQAIVLRDADENNVIFCPANGQNYIYGANTGTWQSVNPIAGVTATKLVTRAYVNGRTFICYEGKGIYEYNIVTGVFAKLVLTGVIEANIRGIGGSSNYLLCFDTLTVYWSSLVDPTDFTPSLQTGAGNQIPQDVKARITALLGIAGGFIIYTAKNAVSAVYTNNTRSPFTFKEVSAAGGIRSYEQVTSEQNAGPHYAWTSSGLQKITIQGAEPVSAEVNDFLAGKLWEYFDPATNKLVQVVNTENEFPVKLAYISSRWLVVSYNTTGIVGGYNYALIFDTTLKRWGKLKIDHVDCFYYPYPNLFGNLTYDNLTNTSYDNLSTTSYADLAVGVTSDPPSKRCIGFLQKNGAVQLLTMDYNKTVAQQGVIIFGKFQLLRSNLMQLQQVDFEGSYPATDTGLPQIKVFASASIEGAGTDLQAPMVLLKSSSKYAKYAKRMTGTNITLVVTGTFAFSTYIVEATQDGDR